LVNLSDKQATEAVWVLEDAVLERVLLHLANLVLKRWADQIAPIDVPLALDDPVAMVLDLHRHCCGSPVVGSNVLTLMAFVNTFSQVMKHKGRNIMLTTRRAVPDDGDMKDKWLQVRVDDAIKSKLLEIRRAEADLPGDSEMIRRLIERAERSLKRRGKEKG
jgi:hypothetical protein